jgi:hypothetical protein
MTTSNGSSKPSVAMLISVVAILAPWIYARYIRPQGMPA